MTHDTNLLLMIQYTWHTVTMDIMRGFSHHHTILQYYIITRMKSFPHSLWQKSNMTQLISQITILPNRLKAYFPHPLIQLSLSPPLTSLDLYPVVLLDAQFVHIVVAVQNSKPKPSRLIRVLLCHNLYVSHFPVLLYHVQNVLFRGLWGESAQKYLLCSLVGLRVLLLTRDCTLAFHLTSDKGRKM